MELLVLGVLVVTVVVAVSFFASKVNIATPLALVAAGIALTAVPSLRHIEVDPEWILAGILPPLLYATSTRLPVMDFRRDLPAISGLSIVLVVITALSVGWLMSRLIPEIGFATGVAIGAVVSPTDAVATSIARSLGVSPRLLTVLEGESLLNDASALVLLRAAVAAIGASVSLAGVLGSFIYSIVIAAAIGYAVGRLAVWVRSRMQDETLSTAVSFVVPFAAYLPVERLGGSGLVAAVTAGLVTSVGAGKHLRAQDRLADRANWSTIGLILEGTIFLLMGMQLIELVQDVREEHESLWKAGWLALAAGLTVLLVRAAYVALLLWTGNRRVERTKKAKEYWTTDEAKQHLYERVSSSRRTAGMDEEQVVRAGRRMWNQRLADFDYILQERWGARDGAMLVWAGMRGAVTVAAAQTLPANTPQRSLLILVAFFVAGGSLLIQGGTLRPLVRRLGLTGNVTDRSEIESLISTMQVAGEKFLDSAELRRADGSTYDADLVDRMKGRTQSRADLRPAADDPEGIDRANQMLELRIAVLDAERRRLLEIRRAGTAPSEVLSELLNVLDADQISLEMRRREPGPMDG